MEEHRLRMEEANQGYILRQEFVKTGQAKKAERLVSLLVHFLWFFFCGNISYIIIVAFLSRWN